MPIPEDQLTTWASIGAQQTSKSTYATIKSCLDAGDYSNKPFCNFLQGSYGNDTNIRVESDVDVVMEMTGIYYYDLSMLPPAQEQAFKADHSAANYGFNDFRATVIKTLAAKFGADVVPGTKAIAVRANGNRRKADVLACVEHHKLTFYATGKPEQKVDGICFFKSDGAQVVNYPRLHADALTTKNQATSEWFKHLVRIFKNARQRLIEDGVIQAGVAPSYYIEGLLYNVPPGHFGKSYAASMLQALVYLSQSDKSRFRCPNGQYPLLDGNTDVTWNTKECNEYIAALIELWSQW